MKNPKQQNICDKCIHSKKFAKLLKEEWQPGKCSFDKHHMWSREVISVKKMTEHFDKYFSKYYQLSQNYILRRKKGAAVVASFRGQTYYEILQEELECDEKVIEAMIASHTRERDPDWFAIHDDSNLFEHIDTARERENAELADYYYEIEAIRNGGEPFDNLEKTLPQISNLLENSKSLPYDLQTFQLMMLFTFSITTLESYLSGIFIQVVLKDIELKKRFLHNTDKKIRLHEIFDKYDSIDLTIKDMISKITWHNLPSAKDFYKKVLKIDLGDDIGLLIKMVKKRHDFVHRCGMDKEGNNIFTTEAEICQIIDAIKKISKRVEKALKELN